MKRFEFSCYVSIKANSEGEARGKLGTAQSLLEDQLPDVQLSLEDGAPIEVTEDGEEE